MPAEADSHSPPRRLHCSSQSLLNSKYLYKLSDDSDWGCVDVRQTFPLAQVAATMDIWAVGVLTHYLLSGPSPSLPLSRPPSFPLSLLSLSLSESISLRSSR
eukprot:1518018-Rhodomonas_salina.1